MIKLKDDPLVELLGVVNTANPLIDTSKLLFRKCVTAVGSKNTRIEFTGDPTKGMIGTIALNYDRQDFSKIFGKYGAVIKYPTVRVFGDAGVNTSLAVLAPRVNEALGTNIQLSGDYRDFSDVTVTYPAKGAKQRVTALANAPASGAKPCSLRFAPNTYLNIDVLNQGSKLSELIPIRSVYPYHTAVNNFVFSYGTLPLDSSVRHSHFSTFMEDFTECVAEAPTIANTCNPSYVSIGQYSVVMNNAIKVALNAKLAELGCPAINSGFAWTSSSNNTATAWGNLAKLTSAAAYANDPRVNKAYTHVLIIAASGVDAKAGWLDTALYLHYNQLY